MVGTWILVSPPGAARIVPRPPVRLVTAGRQVAPIGQSVTNRFRSSFKKTPGRAQPGLGGFQKPPGNTHNRAAVITT